MKKNKKLFIIAIILSLCALLAVLELTHVTNFITLKRSNGNQAQDGPTPEQKQQEAEANADAKLQLIDTPDEKNESTGNTPTTKSSIDISAKQENNNTVTVFTKLTGYSSGSCELVVRNSGKTSTQKANVFYQPEFSSCAGFSIPIDSLGKGTWSIKLTVTQNGHPESKTITQEVK